MQACHNPLVWCCPRAWVVRLALWSDAAAGAACPALLLCRPKDMQLARRLRGFNR
jgi:hypothetical protein